MSIFVQCEIKIKVHTCNKQSKFKEFRFVLSRFIATLSEILHIAFHSGSRFCYFFFFHKSVARKPSVDPHFDHNYDVFIKRKMSKYGTNEQIVKERNERGMRRLDNPVNVHRHVWRENSFEFEQRLTSPTRESRETDRNEYLAAKYFEILPL